MPTPEEIKKEEDRISGLKHALEDVKSKNHNLEIQVKNLISQITARDEHIKNLRYALSEIEKLAIIHE